MDLNDLINQCNQQYDEVDSKQAEVKEEKIDVEEILKLNEVTEKWLEEEREYQANAKDDSHSKSAFTRRSTKTSYQSDKSEKKEEKKSSYGSYYQSGKEERRSPYSSYSSSSSSTKKTSDEIFYEKVESSFNDKINRMVEDAINKQLNRIDDEFEWDILDMQYELNKKRLAQRDYEDEPITREFIRNMEKASSRCSRKVDMAELLLVLKVNPYR